MPPRPSQSSPGLRAAARSERDDAPRTIARRQQRPQRASMLITAMLVATVVGAGLVGYINLSTTALKLAQRTYYLNDAASLAEAGLEEATYCFKQMEAGTAINTVWSGWTLSGSNAHLTLPSFSRGVSAVGVVKVYVNGYNGTVSIPSVISQATITPLDGSPPVTKTLKMGLRKKGAFNTALITSSSLNFGSQTTVDSFNSNPSGVAGATPLAYPGNGASANGSVVVLGGSVDLGTHGMVNGSLYLKAGVTSPPQSQVNGTIVTNYTGTFPLPAFPALASIDRGYLLLVVPATLPRASDSPASDGRYYYFSLLSPLQNTTFTAGKHVTIVASGVNVTDTLTIQAGASVIVYTYGTFTTSGSSVINNLAGASALQIFSSSSGKFDLAQKVDFYGCIYAPYAEVTANGGGSSPAFVGAVMAKTIKCSAKMAFHYDEALQNASTVVGIGWTVTTWYDLQGSTESHNLAAATGGFLL